METEKPKLSLDELAKAAVLQVENEDAQKEDQRVKELLVRLGEINSQFEKTDKIIGDLRENQRAKVLATLEESISALKNEKKGILDDEGVQLAHIKELTREVSEAKAWDDINSIVEGAIERGWFEEPARNSRGNISFETLRFPGHKNPELRKAMADLKRAVMSKISDKAKSQK